MKTGYIRIIGGNWRATKLKVHLGEGLRPTPDRIRETLFNWLAGDCSTASVLDCFAGSGVLGLEALSRGAKQLVCIEKNPTALKSLREVAQRLAIENIEILAGDALKQVKRLDQKFDMVFIDPPYADAQLRSQIFVLLETNQCLQDYAKIYFEWPISESFELPSAKLNWLKNKNAGGVNYAIAQWRQNS